MSRNTHIPEPVIAEVECRGFSRDVFNQKYPEFKNSKLIFNYPTVYIIYSQTENPHSNRPQYLAYVGETNDIVSRTKQHFGPDAKTRDDWRDLAERAERDHSSVLQYIIGNAHFNKSLTLDVENRMMQYLLGSGSVKELHNRRANAQGNYFTQGELETIFSKIWGKLHRRNPDLFPLESVIRDSALFKASPFHQLTTEQREAEEEILAATRAALLIQSTEDHLADGEFGQLILVQGAAGTGKTVLISHLFNRLAKNITSRGELIAEDEEVEGFEEEESRKEVQGEGVSAYVLIQHNEQRHVYNQVAKKLGLQKRAGEIVQKPTSFIGSFSEPKKDKEGNPIRGPRNVNKPKGRADIALVDEAHLLLTQGNQGYQGKNMLLDIMRRAKVTIAVFDPAQILQSAQQWDEDDLAVLLSPTCEEAPQKGELVSLKGGERFLRSSILLKQQMRISAGKKTIEWIDDFAAGRGIGTIPHDHPVYKGGKKIRDAYEIKVFSSPVDLFLAIKTKAAEAEDKGLSRVLATYDWAYKNNKHNELDPDGMWNVELHLEYDGTWRMGLSEEDDKGFEKDSDASGSTRFCHPWNYCLSQPGSSKLEEETAWAEKPETIDEIGSTYTIQGFDLNYAGVIIGPSVKFRDGKICFDASSSKNSQATNKRNGTLDYSEMNLRNELSVLLKRGVHGLYLFAVDPELQAELMRAQEEGGL